MSRFVVFLFAFLYLLAGSHIYAGEPPARLQSHIVLGAMLINFSIPQPPPPRLRRARLATCSATLTASRSWARLRPCKAR